MCIRDSDHAQQGGLKARLQDEMRANTYDKASGVVTVSEDRATVRKQVAEHYKSLFGTDPELNTLRARYAISAHPVPDPVKREAMTAFFWWSAWATTTNRPDDT